MKFYLILIVIFIVSCSSQKEVSNITLSDILYKKQNKIAINKLAPYALKKNRDEIKWLENIEFSTNNDTIFLLEAYNLNTETNILTTYAELWRSSGNKFSYERINRGAVKQTNKSYFTNYMKYLIRSWNTKLLKDEEEAHAQISGFDIYATKIIFTNGKCNVECVSFVNFNNFKKEQEFE